MCRILEYIVELLRIRAHSYTTHVRHLWVSSMGWAEDDDDGELYICHRPGWCGFMKAAAAVAATGFVLLFGRGETQTPE